MNDHIKLPQNLEGLKPVLILPLLSTLVVGLIMIFVVGPPVTAVLNALTGWLNGMQASSAVLLGALLGAMMAFDMGGPVNKAAYTFAVGLLASKVYGPMAAVMAAGMTPPLGAGAGGDAVQEPLHPGGAGRRQGGGRAGHLVRHRGRDPLRRQRPAAGHPLPGGRLRRDRRDLAGGGRAKLMVPHGGVFVLLIPHAVEPLGMYLVAILAGTLVTAAALYLVKRPIARDNQ